MTSLAFWRGWLWCCWQADPDAVAVINESLSLQVWGSCGENESKPEAPAEGQGQTGNTQDESQDCACLFKYLFILFYNIWRKWQTCGDMCRTFFYYLVCLNCIHLCVPHMQVQKLQQLLYNVQTISKSVLRFTIAN